MKVMKSLSLCVFLFIASAVHADFTGTVVKVIDGDTVDVLVDHTPVRVRLAEIDAPEKAQPFGTKSRQTLAAAVFQKTVSVHATDTDRYGRTIGTILLNGQSVNKKMVAQGMAWAYRQYLSDRSLLTMESRARVDKVGLWVDPHALAPWEWRAAKRNKH
jgi:endonuclease YncB( thermonuclease family)